MQDTCYLLVGHGSRNPAGNAETGRFAEAWRARHPGRRVELCFIEHAEVLLPEGLDRAARAAARVVVVPVILNAAGHVKMELPAAIEAARRRHPGVRFDCARHLGMGRALFAVLQARLDGLMRTLAVPDPRTTGVILLGRGSSDAGANGELARMARWLFEANDFELVDLAFTGVAWPRLERVVQRQALLGMTQICIVPVYLFSGILTERIGVQVERLRGQYPTLAFALGERFGFEPAILDLLDARAGDPHAAPGGLLECDGCRYRAAAEAGAAHHHGHAHHAADAPVHLAGGCAQRHIPPHHPTHCA